MKKTSDIIETLEEESKLKKARHKDLVVKSLISIAASFILAFIIKLIDLSSYTSFATFFTLENIKDIAIITAVLSIVGIILVGCMIYVLRNLKHGNKALILMYVILIITYVLCFIFGVFISIYVVPLMLSALLIAALIDKRLGIVANLLINQVFFLTYLLFLNDKSEIIQSVAALVTSTVAGISTVIIIDKAKTRLRFIIMGIVIGITSAVITFLINLINPNLDIEEVLLLTMWSGLSAILSVGLFMLILPILEYVFRQNTIFRLAEYSSLDTPLLKRLAKEAPGTFNHSLVVGNLAEMCAMAIGENAQLAKAASYYHDVGKLKNPLFFVENQKGYNPHDDLIPEVSVKMITEHTAEGYALIKKAHLPDIIAEVAREHHGTTPVGYFLYKAQKLTEDDLDREEFSYNDPNPSNKISAIIMIADTVEAATRATISRLGDPKELRNFIHKLIKDKVDLNLFNNCDITFKDLQIIEDTLVEAVPGFYHSRVQYQTNARKS